MPKKIRPGQSVHAYRITEHLNTGAMALAYAAVSPAGEKVFFKQYKSPSVTVPWYRGYLAYQAELKRRIEGGRVGHFCYRFLDNFEAEFGPRTYFQVFEFVERGHDLATLLSQMRERPASVTWDQRVLLAKVLMAGIAALHEARIVHADLKPENVQLFEDPTIKVGYQLKLIDMDFSILADRLPPWHGQMGYVGSPGYFSPRHLSGDVPLPASDVFQCGLILYELLASRHPYQFEDTDAYARAVRGHEANPPRLDGRLPAPADTEAFVAAMHRCLDPDPSRRPTAMDLSQMLRGMGDYAADDTRAGGGSSPTLASLIDEESDESLVVEETAAAAETFEVEERPGVDAMDPDDVTTPPAPVAAELAEVELAEVEEPAAVSLDSPPAALRLVGETGQAMLVRIRTPFHTYLLRRFGDDARYADKSLQFTLEPDGGGGWRVSPNVDVVNETLLNGKAVTGPMTVAAGDTLGIGREAKGVVKLPLRIELA